MNYGIRATRLEQDKRLEAVLAGAAEPIGWPIKGLFSCAKRPCRPLQEGRHVLQARLKRFAYRGNPVYTVVVPRYQPHGDDLDKRHPDRRIMVLAAIEKMARTPMSLAAEWKMHPSTTFRSMERLRKAGCLERSGRGVHAVYAITKRGLDRLDWLKPKRKKKDATP